MALWRSYYCYSVKTDWLIPFCSHLEISGGRWESQERGFSSVSHNTEAGNCSGGGGRAVDVPSLLCVYMERSGSNVISIIV